MGALRDIVFWNKKPDYLSFLESRGCDDKGRTIDQILQYTDWQLEHLHDYIQRVFPTQEQSQYSFVAPLTDEDISVLKESTASRNNIGKMYLRMLQFWQIEGQEYKIWDGSIHRHWNKTNNHNFRRMTRVYKCLRLLGMMSEADDFAMRLSFMLEQPGCHISSSTRKLWKKLLVDMRDV